MFRVWIALFVAFVIYTCSVYSYCDNRSVNESTPTTQALDGWKTWQQNNCQSCHQIYGLGGYMGPDLTNELSDSTKSEKYIRTFIKYGTGKMPNFNLSDSEVNNLMAFLKWVDKSGRTKVRKENVTWSGNYNLQK